MAESGLQGQTALVTGGARRLGRAIALTLAAAGADVVVHYCKSAAEARICGEEIAQRGRRVWLLSADLSSPAEAEALFSRAEAAAGKPLAILVNNAAIYPPASLLDLTAENLGQCIQINAFAPLQIARFFAAAWEKRGVGEYLPNIVNLLDCRVADFAAQHAGYFLAKRLLFDITLALARELAPTIRVNAVAPGHIIFPHRDEQKSAKSLAGAKPLPHRCTPSDVASAVLFLATHPALTGQVIYVDGGRHLRGPLFSPETNFTAVR